MYIYKHKIQYYETDKMGITHHSNYLRIMEETRIDMMESMGYGYEKMEAEGVISPVMSIQIDYKSPTTYPDLVEVHFSVLELGKLKVRFGYKMYVGDKLVCQASSLHCFLSREGRPQVVADRFPDMFHVLEQHLEN